MTSLIVVTGFTLTCLGIVILNAADRRYADTIHIFIIIGFAVLALINSVMNPELVSNTAEMFDTDTGWMLIAVFSICESIIIVSIFYGIRMLLYKLKHSDEPKRMTESQRRYQEMIKREQQKRDKKLAEQRRKLKERQ